MRLGPFDLDASTSLSLIYTTNVDGESKSAAEAAGREREDYYLLYTLSMTLHGPTTPTSELNFNTGLSIEKHFVRDDLDNQSDPFGQALLSHRMELGRLELDTLLEFRRENTQEEGESTRIYIPGQRKDRVVQDTRRFDQRALFARDPFTLNAGYSYQQRRFLDEEFKDGDENQETIDFGARWDIIRWGGERRLDTFYTYARERTTLVGRPDDPLSGAWKISQAAGLTLQILSRPSLTYTLAYQKDDDEDWRPTHTFVISDEWDLSPTMVLDYNASYTIDQQAREDDIAFIYSVGLAHEVGRTLRHSIRATREPVDTFGSTTDTDSTTVAYNLSKDDLFFANLTFNWGVIYQRNEPQGAGAPPVEETWSYITTLSHNTAISRRLERDLIYFYRYETSNLSDEPVDEHRVTLTFTFTF